MSKKRYGALAAILKVAKTQPDAEQWQLIVEAIARMCASDNPQFDEMRFYKACDYPLVEEVV